jgi:hypothetical protein
LVNGLLISVPLWVVCGLAVALVLRDGPINEAGSAALMIAAACVARFLRPYSLELWSGLWRSARNYRESRVGESTPSAYGRIPARRVSSIEDLLRSVETLVAPPAPARKVRASYPLLRQSLALGALVVAYLQYYFLEVNLQIASMQQLVVFVPVTAAG